MNRYLKTSIAGLALAAAVYGPTATADPDSTAQHTKVTFRDLNVQSREGAAALYKRIEHAADSMCGLSWSMREMGRGAASASAVHECKLQAIERAVTQINAPMLTEAFREKAHLGPEPAKLARVR